MLGSLDRALYRAVLGRGVRLSRLSRDPIACLLLSKNFEDLRGVIRTSCLNTTSSFKLVLLLLVI